MENYGIKMCKVAKKDSSVKLKTSSWNLWNSALAGANC